MLQDFNHGGTIWNHEESQIYESNIHFSLNLSPVSKHCDTFLDPWQCNALHERNFHLLSLLPELAAHPRPRLPQWLKRIKPVARPLLTRQNPFQLNTSQSRAIQGSPQLKEIQHLIQRHRKPATPQLSLSEVPSAQSRGVERDAKFLQRSAAHHELHVRIAAVCRAVLDVVEVRQYEESHNFKWFVQFQSVEEGGEELGLVTRFYLDVPRPWEEGLCEFAAHLVTCSKYVGRPAREENAAVTAVLKGEPRPVIEQVFGLDVLLVDEIAKLSG